LRCRVDVVDLADASFRLAGRILTKRVVLTGHGSPERSLDDLARFRDTLAARAAQAAETSVGSRPVDGASDDESRGRS
jgi:hypothetical protein